MFRDRITTTIREFLGYNEWGEPVYTDVTSGPIPAEVRPLGSAETVDAGANVVTTRYRVFVGPDTVLDATSAVTWRGGSYEVEGDLEPHVLGGRVHHHELIVKRSAI